MFFYFILSCLIFSYYLYRLNYKLLSITILLDKIHKKINYQFVYYTPEEYNYNTDFNEIYNINSTSDSIISNNPSSSIQNDKIYVIL